MGFNWKGSWEKFAEDAEHLAPEMQVVKDGAIEFC